MSNKGIYTALSGAMAQSQRLDTIANNIANSNTTAYKKDAQTFREFLTAYEKTPDVIKVPKVPGSIESFYDMQGGDRGYVDAAGTYTDFSQGGLKPTGNDLDIALEGDGFLEVLTPAGVRLTRSGSLRIDRDGKLVNQSGHPVLKKGAVGEGPKTRMMQMTGSKVRVGHTGNVFSGAEVVGQLSLVKVENKDALKKVGQSQYQIKPNYNVKLENANVKVHQGFLETSNVNIIREMTDMIAASRTFESTQKAIKAFDEMNSRLVNDVPKLR